MSFRFFLLSILSTGALVAPAYALPMNSVATTGLAAHKAIYDVRLSSQKSGSQVVDIKGKMFFEWKPSCDGYITDHRFTLRYDYADNPTLFINSDFSTFESFDGKTLNFSSRRKKDGDTYEELRGVATLDEKGAGRAVFSIPDGLAFDFKQPTLFSTGHTLALIRTAREGKKFYATQTFDGSDEEGPVEVSAIVGKDFPASVADVATNPQKPVTKAALSPIDQSLLTKGWSVRMAFFPSGQDNATSDYELTMKFHDNGIISDMVIDYPDFSVHQKLVALQPLKVESCTQPSAKIPEIKK